MKVEIDLDELILKAAVRVMDRRWEHEAGSVVYALQELIADQTDIKIMPRLRRQVKEYKSLTMWRAD